MCEFGSTAEVRGWLAEQGVRVIFEDGAVTRCLIVDRLERWSGVGADQTTAFEHALAAMFPSRLSRALLSARVRRAEVATEPPAVEAPPLDTPPTPPPEPASRFEPEIPANDPTPIAANSDAVSAAPEEFEPPLDPGTLLEEIEAEVDADEVELGLLAPDRQRLVLLAWIARARALELSDPSLAPHIGRLARRLGELGKRFWPGNVDALRLAATPDETATRLGTHASTWAEVAAHAEARLAALEAEQDLDAWGWADDGRQTHAADPAEVAALRAELEKAEETWSIAPPNGPQILDWVRRLRSLRDAGPGALDWGVAAGILRRTANRDPTPAAARDELAPRFVPSGSWEDMRLRSGPLREARLRAQQAEQEAMLSRPFPPIDDERAWLEHLRALLSTWDNEATRLRVVALLRAHGDRILALPEDGGPGWMRSDRRRLSKLRAMLTAPPTSSELAVPPPPPVAEVSPPPSAPGRTPVDLRLLERTRGRKAILVSNRPDPDLLEQLQRSLELGSIDWCGIEPRRLDALGASIQSRSHHFVLSATGFMGHKVDAKLKSQCRLAGIEYVRVNRGRPASVERALLRDLGLA